MSVIVTYDLDSFWSEVRRSALHNGFDDFIFANDGSVFYLPNTTLKHDSLDKNYVMSKFRDVVRTVDPYIKTNVIAFDWDYARLFNNKTNNQQVLV